MKIRKLKSVGFVVNFRLSCLYISLNILSTKNQILLPNGWTFGFMDKTLDSQLSFGDTLIHRSEGI